MNKAQIGAIIIVVIMVGSIMAYGVGFLTRGQSQSPAPTDNQSTGQQNATAIAFSAENVKGMVLEVSPQIIFSAYTSEAEIYKLDDLISQAGGSAITGMASEYKTSNDSSQGSLVYLARIAFDDSFVSGAELADAFSNISAFVSPEAYGIALVEIPKNITFSNAELDLNKDYVFEDQLIQAFVSLESRQGDEIDLLLDSQFQGQELVQLIAFESNNITGELIQASLEQESKIVSLKNSLTFNGKLNYSDFLDENSLKEKILALNEIIDANISAVSPDNSLNIFIDGNHSDKISDLNAAMNAFPELNAIEFFPTDSELEIQLGFIEPINLPELKNSLKSKLLSFGFDENVLMFVETNSDISGQIETSSIDTFASSDELRALLDSLKFFETEIYQAGTIEESTLTDPETQKVFSLDDNSINAYFLPAHSAGEIVLMKISFLGQREKVLIAQALEKTD